MKLEMTTAKNSFKYGWLLSRIMPYIAPYWFRITILKRTNLPDGTIVAANSLINKEFSEQNTLIGGVPAKVLKSNVKWNEGSYKINMENNFGKNSNSKNIDWNKYLNDKFNIAL